MKGFLLVLLRFYRACISPLKRPTCRFIPTCSEYAIQAVEQYGPYIGLWMSMKRLARCHPFNPGGFDPVDDRKKEARS